MLSLETFPPGKSFQFPAICFSEAHHAQVPVRRSLIACRFAAGEFYF
jgi:hypothetical protein